MAENSLQVTRESGTQFSEDRQWWWTGSEWISASQAPKRAALELLTDRLEMTAHYKSMARTPEDAIRSPDGAQWWDGAAWRPVEIPANAVRSPDGSSWWDGTLWQPVRGGTSRSAETSSAAAELTPTTADSRQPSHFPEKADAANRVIVQVRSVTNGFTVYTVTAERFTVKSGMLRQEQTIPLRNVQEVRIEKGLTGYRVRVTSAAGVIRTDRLLPDSAERLRNAILGIGDTSARPSGQTLGRLDDFFERMKPSTARTNAELARRKADNEHWKALKAERDRRDGKTK
jgi:hypothetical protein